MTVELVDDGLEALASTIRDEYRLSRESLTDAEQGALDHLIGLVPQATLSRTFRRDGQLYADVRVGNCLYVYEIAPRYRYRRVS